jgi:DEAD/DEAH box helicase domain-containing protein
MRLHQPRSALEALELFLAEPGVGPAVAARHVLPAREADFVSVPEWLDARLVRALEQRGIHALYRHQREALDALHEGEDVVIVTPTASGKSLCYNLPVLQAVGEDPAARALYLFPTKALSQDQLAEFRDLSSLAGMELSAAVYDGDTPTPIRAMVREAGQVVVTNPDMLSTAILPHHTKWFQLFEQLRFIVIDEAHTYRGIFGSHVANVLRRLLRICAHYGSSPRIVCASATVGNPDELARTLTGRSFRVIDRSGAPQGERHVVVLDPTERRCPSCGQVARPSSSAVRVWPWSCCSAHCARPCARVADPSSASVAIAPGTCPASEGPSRRACAAAKCWAWSPPAPSSWA